MNAIAHIFILKLYIIYNKMSITVFENRLLLQIFPRQNFFIDKLRVQMYNYFHKGKGVFESQGSMAPFLYLGGYENVIR